MKFLQGVFSFIVNVAFIALIVGVIGWAGSSLIESDLTTNQALGYGLLATVVYAALGWLAIEVEQEEGNGKGALVFFTLIYLAFLGVLVYTQLNGSFSISVNAS